MSASTLRERLGEVVQFFKELDAALFTTFNFSPDFFEQNVLPVALGVEAGNSAAVHDRLIRTPVMVFYDPSFEVRPGNVFRSFLIS